MLFGQRLPRREHVVVHPLDPRDEAVEVARPARLAHPVHRHSAELPHPGLAAIRSTIDAPRENVHRDPLAHERLGELAHVARQPALDHGRVLPGEKQHAIAHSRDPISPARAVTAQDASPARPE